jgi:hypothetical protein
MMDVLYLNPFLAEEESDLLSSKHTGPAPKFTNEIANLSPVAILNQTESIHLNPDVHFSPPSKAVPHTAVVPLETIMSAVRPDILDATILTSTSPLAGVCEPSVSDRSKRYCPL